MEKTLSWKLVYIVTHIFRCSSSVITSSPSPDILTANFHLEKRGTFPKSKVQSFFCCWKTDCVRLCMTYECTRFSYNALREDCQVHSEVIGQQTTNRKYLDESQLYYRQEAVHTVNITWSTTTGPLSKPADVEKRHFTTPAQNGRNQKGLFVEKWFLTTITPKGLNSGSQLVKENRQATVTPADSQQTTRIAEIVELITTTPQNMNQKARLERKHFSNTVEPSESNGKVSIVGKQILTTSSPKELSRKAVVTRKNLSVTSASKNLQQQTTDNRQRTGITSIPNGSKSTNNGKHLRVNSTVKWNEERLFGERLLIVKLFSVFSHPLLQLDLRTMSKQRYPFLKLQTTNAITYVWALRTILIASYFPDRIKAYRLDSSHSSTIRKHIRCVNMAVDEGRQLVFLTTRSVPQTSVCQMTTKGEDLKVVLKAKHGERLYTILALPQQETIFVNFGKRVISLRYDGRNRKTILKCRSMISITLDRDRNLFYYGQKKQLFKRNLTEDDSTLVASFRRNVLTVYYYGSGVAVKTRSTDLNIVDVPRDKTRVLRKMFSLMSSSYWHFCSVP